MCAVYTLYILVYVIVNIMTYGYKPFKRLTIPEGLSVELVVCIYLSGREPHRQVVMDRMIASESLNSVMVQALSLEWQVLWVPNMFYETMFSLFAVCIITCMAVLS